MIRLFIIDDHNIVIKGISQAVANHPDIEVVGSGFNGDEAMSWLSENTTDVILLDVSLPGQDGIDLCKEIKKQWPDLKIIGLTTFSQVSFITSMLRSGADGYLFKNVSEQELIEAIIQVNDGKRYLAAEVNEKLITKAVRQSSQPNSFIPKLTRREKEVLELIMEEYTTLQIAEALFLSPSTIETHRMNLCAKLGAKNTAGLVKNAIKFGFA